MVTIIPSQLLPVIFSPRISQLIRAVMGGARAIRSMEMRAPTTTNDWNRQRSPKVKPMRPEMTRISQVRAEASTGRR